MFHFCASMIMERPKGRFDNFKIFIEDEYFVTGGNIGVPMKERDSAQATIKSSSLPVNRGGIPINNLGNFARLQIHKINPAVALTLAHGSYD